MTFSLTLPPVFFTVSLAFDTEHLLQLGHDFNKVGLVVHYFSNRLVGARYLVDHVCVLTTLYSSRLQSKVRDCESSSRLAAGHSSTSSVRAAIKALRVSFSSYDKGSRAH